MKKLASLSCLFILISCVKDKPVAPANESLQIGPGDKVYVINEGNFGSGNASISLYDPGTRQVAADYYKLQNSDTVGDVAQHLSFFNGSFYIVVNNSGKIIVCNRELKKTGEIKGLTSPRYLVPVTNKKAYASDYKSGHLNILDLNIKTVTGTIPLPGWTEQMALVQNKVFVTNLQRDYLYVINTLNDVVQDSIIVGPWSAGIVMDCFDRLWVLSGGDAPRNLPPKLSRIDPSTNAVELTLSFPAADFPSGLCINESRDRLFFLNKGIYAMDAVSQQLPASPLVASGSRNYYGLGIHPSGNIYVSDVLDFVQRSNIYIYNSAGVEQSFFKAGLISNGFYFE